MKTQDSKNRGGCSGVASLGVSFYSLLDFQTLPTSALKAKANILFFLL